MPEQYLSCLFEILVNFGHVFSLVFRAFIVDFEYSLFVVNLIKCLLMAYLCGTPKMRYNYGSCCKTLVCICSNDSPYMRCSSKIFVYKLL